MLSFSGASSFDPDGSIVTYQWTFGDGQSASGMNTSHAYATPGTYTVTLTVTDNRGATNADTATVSAANRPPLANAGADRSAVQGTSLAFSGAASSDPDGSIASYTWTFGDGGSGSGVAPSHTYTAAGTYTATLTVTDNKNATASDSLVVTVTAGSTTWARRLGAAGSDSANAVAVDAAGNVFVGGTMRGGVDFGGISRTSAGGSDWFVAKYTPSNGLVWARLMGGTSDDTLTNLAIDRATGDVIVVGRISGTVNMGGSNLVASGASDMAIGRFAAADGAHIWSKRFGGTTDDSVDAVAVDGAGNVVFTGYFRGTIDFGKGPMSVPFDTDLDVFVAKLDGAGTTLWAEHFTNSGNDHGYGIAVDATNDIAITGTFSNTIDFGGGPLTSGSGMLDAFVTKLSPAGVHLWSKQLGAADANEGGNAVAFDPSGNLFFLGYAIAAIDAGGGSLDALGGSDVVLVKYSGTGAHLWSRRMGGVGNDYGYGLAVDTDGSVVVAGSADAQASFGGAPMTPLGADDVVVAKLGPTGLPTWSRMFGGISAEIAQDVTIGPGGIPIVAGYFFGSGTYGGVSLTSAGASDAFVTSLAP